MFRDEVFDPVSFLLEKKRGALLVGLRSVFGNRAERHFGGEPSAELLAGKVIAASVEHKERRGERLLKGAGGIRGRGKGGRRKAKGEADGRDRGQKRFYL